MRWSANLLPWQPIIQVSDQSSGQELWYGWESSVEEQNSEEVSKTSCNLCLNAEDVSLASCYKSARVWLGGEG